MADLAYLDRRIKRLGRTEARLRARIKDAEARIAGEPDRKTRHEREVAKLEKKLAKVLPKIRRLREVRAREKGRR